MNNNSKNKGSFTLIELLVVLALVAILSVVVILTLNPAELIKQARDSNRLSDLSTINTALNLFSADVTSGFMGTSTAVYVSIPDTSPTCANLGLPTLPGTYTYNCVTAANLRNTNGTGWIPVNFQRISSNSPISQLPIDPINTTTTRLYYTYVSGGSWELNASIEASKNKLGGSGDLVSKDGGTAASQYEIGNNLNLNPIEAGDTGLVGYWNFDEGSGATAYDRSGNSKDGTLQNSPSYSLSGCKNNYCLNFNTTSDANQYISLSGEIVTTLYTKSMWIYPTSLDTCGVEFTVCTFMGTYFTTLNSSLGYYSQELSPNGWFSGGTLYINQWRYATVSFDGARIRLYLDGQEIFTQAAVSTGLDSITTIGALGSNFRNFKGKIDDVRIYNRALSAAEVLALYNATK